jgi:hypothetical protein
MWCPRQTRSLVVSGKKCQLDGVPFKVFKKLRVLEIKSSRLENGHLVDICELIWLRYLVLNSCRQITELPREIGRLQNLQTLDVSSTNIRRLPVEIGKLKRLETLDVSRTEVMELPTEIGKLQHLRTLDISKTQVREVPCSKDPNPLLSVVVKKNWEGVVVKFRLVDISPSGGEGVVISSSEAKYMEYLSILVLFNHLGGRCEVLPVRMLRVAPRHMKVPQWVKKDLCNVCSLDIRLCKLEEEDVEFLKTQMPNLQALKLRFEVLPRATVAITRGGFTKLETFYVDCRLPRVVTFKRGAMPKLKHLDFKFYSDPATSQDCSMGIKNLDSLEKVVFRCSGYYTSDGPGISATIDGVRKEVGNHTKKGITIWVNECIVSCVREREVKQAVKQPDIKERRNAQIMAIEKRAQWDKYRGRGGIRS